MHNCLIGNMRFHLFVDSCFCKMQIDEAGSCLCSVLMARCFIKIPPPQIALNRF